MRSSAAKRRKIQAAIFDLGNVVIAFDLAPMFKSWARSCGVPVKQIVDVMSFDEVFHDFERGDITPKQFHWHLRRKLGVDLSYADFERGWNSIWIGMVKGVEKLLADLAAQGLRMMVLSNTNELHERSFRKVFRRELSVFERIFTSNEVRARKPHRDSYSAVLEHLSIPPQQVAFVDDLIENVDAARALGMIGIHAAGTVGVRKEFQRHGVLPVAKTRRKTIRRGKK